MLKFKYLSIKKLYFKTLHGLWDKGGDRKIINPQTTKYNSHLC